MDTSVRRVERLLQLIEGLQGADGADRAESTRTNLGKTIGQQLCRLCAASPELVTTVLLRLYGLLKKKQFEVRVAAAAAVAAVGAQIEMDATVAAAAPSSSEGTGDDALLTLQSFDIEVVLRRGSLLMATAGKEYEQWEDEQRKLPPEERLRRARRHLKKRLGIDTCEGADDIEAKGEENYVDSLVKDDDLVTWRGQTGQSGAEPPSVAASGEGAANGRNGNVEPATLDPAARRAMYKKKRAEESRPAADVFAQASKRQRFAREGGGKREDATNASSIVGDDAGCDGRENMRKLCFQLLDDTLSPRWEVRHGAATCLRDVIGASKRRSASGGWAWMTNGWLEDCVSRVICVLALDRFGDYESDFAVAPVREIAGQVIGSVLFLIPSEKTLARAASMIIKLVNNDDDDVRFGGMIGLKYLFAVAKAVDAEGRLVREVLDDTLPTIVSVLDEKQDDDEIGAGDDVRAAGMDALIHIAAQLEGPHRCDALVKILWKLLADDDDVTTVSTNALRLLVELYSESNASKCAGLPPLSELMRRATRFLGNALRDTRLAAAALLKRLASSTFSGSADGGAIRAALSDTLKTVILSILHEETADVRLTLEGAWRELVVAEASPDLHELIDEQIVSLCSNRPPGLLNVNAWPPSAKDRDRESDVLGTRMNVARCLANAIGAVEARDARGHMRSISDCLDEACCSSSTVHRQFAAEVVYNLGRSSSAATALADRLLDAIAGQGPPSQLFDEASMLLSRMRASHVALCRASGMSEAEAPGVSLPDTAIQFAQTEVCSRSSPQARARVVEDANALKAANFAYLVAARVYQSRAALAVAPALPAKLTPLISPLMRTVEAETEPLRVWTAGVATGLLLRRCVLEKKSAGSKVLSKLYRLVVENVLPRETVLPAAMEAQLHELLSDALHATAFASTESLAGRGGLHQDCQAVLVADRANRAREAMHRRAVYRSIASGQTHRAGTGNEQDLAPEVVALVNAEMAMRIVVAAFDDAEALQEETKFWESFFSPLRQVDSLDESVVGALHVVSVLADLMPGSPRLAEILPHVMRQTKRDSALIRMFAARACAALACASAESLLPTMVASLTSSLVEHKGNVAIRRGVSAALSEIGANFRRFSFSYVIVLLLPLLKQMADPDDVVRGLATKSFSRMVPFFPLARDAPVPAGLSEAHVKVLLADKRMLVQLLDNASVDDFELSFTPKAPLRRYQQEGVNWLQFLRRFGMHGILADDMGLGKTLQTLCILAEAVRAEEQSRASVACLIVCPNTLVRHWALEATKHVPDGILRPLVVQGSSQERLEQRARLASGNMVICSYETLRNDVDWFASRHWLYCVLDEGHVIKNPKTKVAAAVRSVGRLSSHRLVLSGTPVQNSPAELWGLFQFLMPGFLGSHADFVRAYAGDINRARSKAADADAIIACEDAAERLHKTVMPFIMRRTKDKVLKDLPPKIIQDVIVDETPFQAALRESFAEGGAADPDACPRQPTAANSFASIMFQRKLATHPALVFDADARDHREAARLAFGADKSAAQLGDSVRHIDESPKLTGLKQLLLGCGIGRPYDESDEEDGQPVAAAGHRVLVFAQLMKVLDIVEQDLFGERASARGGLKGVSWLRLDGRTPSKDRVGIAEKFNADPSIHVLLLTTQVGSLGLNLTAADTVIFLEHDWNPQRDLQAMDRAHRIGQRRSVSVYRMITRGTIEEDIMSLQKFKVGIAEAVVNQDNVSVDKMDTGALLDVFTKKASAPKAAGAAGAGAAAEEAAMKPFANLIGSFDELWDKSEYGSEFSISAFTANLQSGQEDARGGEDGRGEDTLS